LMVICPVLLASCSENDKPEIIDHIVVHHEDGYFMGWPANNGGYYWEAFNPEGFVAGFDPEGLTGDSLLVLKEISEPLEFLNENFMLRIT
jgi:hypothetical protein